MANCLLQDGWFSSDRYWLVLSDRRQNREAHPDGRPEISYDQAADQFLSYVSAYRRLSPGTVLAYRSDLMAFRRFLEGRCDSLPAPGRITREMLIQFGMSMTTGPMAVRRRYAVLSSFFSLLRDLGHVEANRARQLPLPKLNRPVPIGLSEEASRKLVAAADRPWTKALVVLLLMTGIRRSEAAAITLGDLDLDKRLLLIRGRGNKERVAPLADEAVDALREYLAHRVPTESRWLFVSARGGHPIHHRTIARMIRSVIRKAELQGRGISPHRFRHTFATQLIRRGVDVRTVQELLGHSSLQTTAKYLHSDMRTKMAAVQKLADILR